MGNVVAIEAGEGASYALKDDGTIWAWGDNTYGQLGDGTNNNSNQPVQVLGPGTFSAISAHHEHVLALRDDSTVWAWGRNTEGEIGDPTPGNQNIPVQVVQLDQVHSIEAGGYFSLVQKDDGTIWAFGTNAYGQLGDGTNTSSAVPVQVVSFPSCISSIATGFWIGLAFEEPDSIMAWGYNNDGELGNGTTVDSNLPINPIGLCPVALPATSPCGFAGIENNIISPASLTVHPNPVTTTVTITSSLEFHDALLQIYDLTGHLVYQQAGLSRKYFQYQTHDLPPGNYVLRLSDNEHNASVRMTILRP